MKWNSKITRSLRLKWDALNVYFGSLCFLYRRKRQLCIFSRYENGCKAWNVEKATREAEKEKNKQQQKEFSFEIVYETCDSKNIEMFI